MKPQKKDGIAPAALCADQTFIKKWENGNERIF